MREQYLIDKKISNKESVHTKKTMICFSLRSNIILQNNNLTLSYDTSREKGERVSLNKRNEKFAYRLHSLKNLCIRINRSSLNWVNKSVYLSCFLEYLALSDGSSIIRIFRTFTLLLSLRNLGIIYIDLDRFNFRIFRTFSLLLLLRNLGIVYIDLDRFTFRISRTLNLLLSIRRKHCNVYVTLLSSPILGVTSRPLLVLFTE